MSARARKPGPLTVDGLTIAQVLLSRRGDGLNWISPVPFPITTNNLDALRAWLDRVEAWDRERRGKQ